MINNMINMQNNSMNNSDNMNNNNYMSNSYKMINSNNNFISCKNSCSPGLNITEFFVIFILLLFIILSFN